MSFGTPLPGLPLLTIKVGLSHPEFQAKATATDIFLLFSHWYLLASFYLPLRAEPGLCLKN